jgi:hypothetical protein
MVGRGECLIAAPRWYRIKKSQIVDLEFSGKKIIVTTGKEAVE